ncbi:hypothetical protein Dimus_001294, partial [Dionaea muscipula]
MVASWPLGPAKGIIRWLASLARPALSPSLRAWLCTAEEGAGDLAVGRPTLDRSRALAGSVTGLECGCRRPPTGKASRSRAWPRSHAEVALVADDRPWGLCRSADLASRPPAVWRPVTVS